MSEVITITGWGDVKDGDEFVPASDYDALAARLAEAERLLYEALINPQGFSLRAVGEFLGDYQPGATDSAKPRETVTL